MFLLPSIVLGVVFALILGGRPSRLLSLRLRHGWIVFAAFAVQVVVFTPVGEDVPAAYSAPLHLGSYLLLFLFAALNARNVTLLPVFLGMAANAAAIAANGGMMPVSPAAADAAGIEAGENIRLGADHIGFLGDVFALPSGLPLANVFSVGDLLIGFGMIAVIVSVATREGPERALVAGRLFRPLTIPSFRRLAAGKLVSHVGDWLTIAALIGWVYGATESTASVAALMLVRLAPPILGGALAAAVVDRLPKQRLLVTIELVRGLVVGGALFAVLADSRPLAFAAVGASGALAAISAANVRALVPSLLPRDQLPAANAGLGIAQDGAMAIGALAAGIVLSTATAVTALVADLGTFAVAAVLYWGIAARPGASARSESGFFAGLRYLGRRRVLLVVIMAFGSATLATGLINATLPRFLGTDLNLGTGAYGYGLAALAAGLTLGQALVGLARVGEMGGRWIGAGLLVMGGIVVLLGLTTHAPTALLLLGLVGVVDGTTDVLFDTIVQRETDPGYYGRVFGVASAFMTMTMMGAVAASPVVNEFTRASDAIVLAGLFLTAASVIALGGTRTRARADAKAAELEPANVVPLPARAPAPRVGVVVRLLDGYDVLVGSFASVREAKDRAREVIRLVVRPEESEWPLLGERFLRPDAIVSIDLVPVDDVIALHPRMPEEEAAG